MEDKYKLLIAALGRERLKMDEPLSYHVFSKIGGPAKYFYSAASLKDLTLALDTANLLKIPFFIIGNGTKILISMKGLSGLVIKNRSFGIKISGIKGKMASGGLGVEEALVEVDSGVSISKLNEFLEKQNLKPVVYAGSLNATLGGAMLLDPNFAELVRQIKVWDDGEVEDVLFKKLSKNHIILSAVLRIKSKIEKK